MYIVHRSGRKDRKINQYCINVTLQVSPCYAFGMGCSFRSYFIVSINRIDHGRLVVVSMAKQKQEYDFGNVSFGIWRIEDLS